MSIDCSLKNILSKVMKKKIMIKNTPIRIVYLEKAVPNNKMQQRLLSSIFHGFFFILFTFYCILTQLNTISNNLIN